MRKWWLLGLCLLVAVAAGCDEPDDDNGDEDQQQQQDQQDQDDETADDQDDAFDFDEAITAQDEATLEVWCDRQFGCYDEDDELSAVEGASLEGCYEDVGIDEDAREFLIDEGVDQFESCAEANDELVDCLRDIECGEFIAWLQTGHERAEVCVEETEQQHDACAYYHQWREEQRMPDPEAVGQ